MKKLFSLFIATLCALSIWAEDFQVDGIYYNILTDKTNEVEVTCQHKWSSDNYSYLTTALIPETVTYNGTTYSVTSIGYRTFASCSGLTSITIPNSVTSIGGSAFSGCSGLTSVTIPNSVTSIGSSAFYYCSGLTSVTIPNSVTSIGSSAFYYCSGLTSVTIPNSVTSIGNYAFSDCSGLTSITIGNSVTSIGNYAFSDCSGLISVTINSDAIVDKSYSEDANISHIFGSQVTEYIIGDNVTSIGSSAFRGCSGLTSVTIPNSVTSIGSSAFYNCYRLTSVTIGNSVTSIGGSAFSGCSGLTSVTIPNSVTSIGSSAFYNCYRLTSVTIGNSVTSIGGSAFRGCSGLTSVVVEKGNSFYDSRENCSAIIETASNTLIFGSNNTNIPNSVTSIGNNAFSDCSGLTSITIPNNLTSIGSSAFSGCSGLTSVVWNAKNVADFSSHSDAPFYNIRSNITSFTFGDSVQHIPACLCYGMEKLTSITIQNSVTSIGSSAFSGCSGLTSVVWNAKNVADFSSHSDAPFYNIRSNITSFTFGDSVQHIPACLCHEMSNLTSITIPNSVTTIGYYAFYYCSGLTSITIPKSVTNIGKAALFGTNITSIAWNAKKCDNLPLMKASSNRFNYIFGIYSEKIKYFVFGDSVEHIPSNLCYDMYNLTTITIPNSVTTIGEGAFDECSSLTSIVIPENVTHIDGTAFYGCDDLTSVIWNAKKCADFSYSYDPGGSRIYGPFFKYNGSISSFILGDSVEHIPSYLCYEMSSLSSITIPNSVTSIGSSAFFGCSSLTSVVWNAENCADFSSYSVAPFYDIRSQITSFTFGDSVLHIPSYLCYRMSNLTSITVPNSVTSIGDNAFRYCSSLTSPVYNAHVFAFLPTTYSGAYTINDGITSIAGGAFAESSSLTSITIPCSVMKIGEGAFDKCSSINTIVIKANNLEELCKNNVNNQLVPADIHLIPRKYIVNNEDITDIVVPKSIESINSYALYGCSSLNSISIPNTVTNIGESAFYDCSRLRTISLGSGISSIGRNAFGNCSRLYEVTCYAQDPPIADLTSFANYDAYLHVPCDALRYYNVDPVWKNFHNIECFDTDATMIENTHSQSPITNCYKLLRDGQLLIIRDGKTYNAQGAAL